MTTRYSPQAKDWSPVRESDAGNVQCAIGYCPTNLFQLNQNDVVEMVKIPIGAIVVDTILDTGAMGANVLGAVGDGDEKEEYITNTAVANASLTRRNSTKCAGIPKVYSAQDTVDVTFSNANPTDNIAFALYVEYVCGLDITP